MSKVETKPLQPLEQKVIKLNVLQEGDYVVLPPHGVGKFCGKAEIEVDGQTQSFFKVRFEADNLETMIPESRYIESGIRKIVTKQVAEKVMEIFTKPPKYQKGLWNKKMQEYDAKIHSGVLSSASEVARDAFSCSIDASKSYTERSKYKKALDIVTQELSVVFGKAYDEMEKEIIDILRAKQVKTQDSEFDTEFDDIENLDEFDEDKLFADLGR